METDNKLPRDGTVSGSSTDAFITTRRRQQPGKQHSTTLAPGGVVAGSPAGSSVVTRERKKQVEQHTTTLTPGGAVARSPAGSSVVTRERKKQVGQHSTTLTPGGAVAGSPAGASVVTRKRKKQEEQHSTTLTPGGAVAGYPAGASVVTRKRKKQEEQHSTTLTPGGAVARSPAGSSVVSRERKKQGEQHSTTLTPGGTVAGSPAGSSVVTSERKKQEEQHSTTLTAGGAVAGSPTGSSVVTWERKKQVEQQTTTLTPGGAVAGSPAGASVATRKRKKQVGQHSTTLTPGGAVAGSPAGASVATTDSLTATEVKQHPGRQPTTTLAPDGTVARPTTDTVTATEAGQLQGVQSFSTTTHYYLPGSVSQCNISNSSNVAFGDSGHRGWISQESLSIRINQLSDMLVQTRALHKAEELLKRHSHVAICGAPGDGKTTAALRICETYMKKNYQVLFVENIEEFDIDVVIKRKCDMLVAFDDIFGSVAVPSSLEKLRKVFNALVDILLCFTRDEELAAEKERKKKKMKKGIQKEDEKQSMDETTEKSNYKLRFIFTSRNYNWNEGCSRLHQFKVNLLKHETIVDMIKTCLTIEEKKQIMTLFRTRSQICSISDKDMKTITELKDSMFGYPLTCKLYFTNRVFQMHSLGDFFLKPVTYLRGDLDTIVREGSSRSAALILLVLCGGKLDLASLMCGTDKKVTDLFHVVTEKVAPCTDTDIEREISNFTGTYCVVENHVASFSHPAIHDAAACAFGNLNSVLLVKHCSLQFLYERVRPNMPDARQTTQADDVTNMIYITSRLYPLMINRIVKGIREDCFRWTVGHPVFRNDKLSSSLMTELKNDLPYIVHRKDSTSGECFLYWTSLSKNDLLFSQSLLLMSKKENLSPENVKDLYESITGCIKPGKVGNLQRIVDVLKHHGEYHADLRMAGSKTLLIIAAEAGQLDVFNFLLQEGANVLLKDRKGNSCLHHACISGKRDIVKVVVEKFPGMIDDCNDEGFTSTLLCAETRQEEILKFLVSHGADLSAKILGGQSCLHVACASGYFSTVQYLLSCEIININERTLSNTTPIMMAAEKGHSDVYHLLVSEGADLSLTSELGRDCLMYACEGGNKSIVRHLLSLKTININRRDHNNMTPVMVAIEAGQSDVYHLLMSEGADVSLTGDKGRDCLMCASERDSKIAGLTRTSGS
ncbi:uncharacterized protein LOC124261824 [Haliotis rubra]|uniref:uncharacterized protein LOC124261824 n=1 Tax=Haliotis rubra TaxID=36100 RepID=UPI001EE4FB59|nr:uncharacterized protein LOC124261824 [Haliotis rubra]